MRLSRIMPRGGPKEAHNPKPLTKKQTLFWENSVGLCHKQNILTAVFDKINVSRCGGLNGYDKPDQQDESDQ